MANSFKKLLCLCQLCLYSRCWSLAAFLATVLERVERKQFVFLTSDYQTKASKNNFPWSPPYYGLLKASAWLLQRSWRSGDPTCERGQGWWLNGDESKEHLSSFFWDACILLHGQSWNGKIHPPQSSRAVTSQLFFYAGKNQLLQSSLKVKATFTFHSELSGPSSRANALKRENSKNQQKNSLNNLD